MKVRFYRWYNAVLTALLSMVGYGCSSTEESMDMYGVIVMYGTPTVSYNIKGTVTDEAGEPIKDIKVSIKHIPIPSVYLKTETEMLAYGVDSIQTTESGKYELKDKGSCAPDLKLIFEDIDGDDNGGEYQSDTLDIDYGKAVKVQDGDGMWDRGVYEITQDVKLKKK